LFVLVFAREVIVCKVSTDVPAEDPNVGELARRMQFRLGGEAELARLDPEHHNAEHVAELRQRLARGHRWVIGEADGRICTYAWVNMDRRATYPSLPGCVIELRPDTGYGYDAWTPPDVRQHGLRRSCFLRELRVLAEMGAAWQASFFVKHQLEGATRSLAMVGIHVVPQLRIWLQRDRSLGVEPLTDDPVARAAFAEPTP
jgi:hypothetical protein